MEAAGPQQPNLAPSFYSPTTTTTFQPAHADTARPEAARLPAARPRRQRPPEGQHALRLRRAACHCRSSRTAHTRSPKAPHPARSGRGTVRQHQPLTAGRPSPQPFSGGTTLSPTGPAHRQQHPPGHATPPAGDGLDRPGPVHRGTPSHRTAQRRAENGGEGGDHAPSPPDRSAHPRGAASYLQQRPQPPPAARGHRAQQRRRHVSCRSPAALSPAAAEGRAVPSQSERPPRERDCGMRGGGRGGAGSAFPRGAAVAGRRLRPPAGLRGEVCPPRGAALPSACACP